VATGGAKAFAAFKQKVDGEMSQIIIDQVHYMLELTGRNALTDTRNLLGKRVKNEAKELKAKYEELKAKFKELKATNKMNKDLSRLDNELLGVQKELEECQLYQEVDDLSHEAEITRQGGGYPGEALLTNYPLRNARQNIVRALKRKGLFVLSYGGRKDCHVVGINVTSQQCELIDANSGLWECISPDALCTLFECITEAFYEDFTSCDVFYYGKWKQN
jgi:hypothetical protein